MFPFMFFAFTCQVLFLFPNSTQFNSSKSHFLAHFNMLSTFNITVPLPCRDLFNPFDLRSGRRYAAFFVSINPRAAEWFLIPSSHLTLSILIDLILIFPVSSCLITELFFSCCAALHDGIKTTDQSQQRVLHAHVLLICPADRKSRYSRVLIYSWVYWSAALSSHHHQRQLNVAVNACVRLYLLWIIISKYRASSA